MLARQGEFKKIARILTNKRKTAVQLLIRRPLSASRRSLNKLPLIGARLQRKYVRDILAAYYDHKPRRFRKSGRINISIITQQGDIKPKSSAFIRLISPLTTPAVADKIALRLYPENTTKVSASTDVCVVQRSVYDDTRTAARLIKNLESINALLIVDSDDGFFAIDSTHPEHSLHQSRIEAFDYLLQHAAQIWLSTAKLASYYKQHAEKTKVVPNSLDLRVWGKDNSPSEVAPKSPLRFVYMGTATHDQDLKLILPALEDIAEEYPGSFTLSVIGVSDSIPQYDWITRVIPSKGSLYPKFVEWFVANNPYDIGLSPLVDTEFNRCKSDIKCLDYLAAGITPMVSAITPYNEPDLDDYIIRVKNSESAWKRALLELVREPAKTRQTLRTKVKSGQDFITRERNVEETGQALYTLIANLIEGRQQSD